MRPIQLHRRAEMGVELLRPQPDTCPAAGDGNCWPGVQMNDWNIQSRAHVCSACERPFADREKYHTALSEDSEGLQRQDVCQDCWDGKISEAARTESGFISHWQGMYEAPPAPGAEPIQKENAESLLRKLIELNDPRHIPAGYILAVMLERKRILKVKEELQRDGQRVFIYEQPKSGDVFTIIDPALQLDQLEAVQREVSLLMEHGLKPPAPVEESAEAAAADPGTEVEEQCATASGAPSS